MPNRAAQVLIEYQSRTRRRRSLNINLRRHLLQRRRTFMLNLSALENACGALMHTLIYDYDSRLKVFCYYPRAMPPIRRLLNSVENYFLLMPVPRWSSAPVLQLRTLLQYIDNDE